MVCRSLHGTDLLRPLEMVPSATTGIAAEAGVSCHAFANHLLGNFGILALRPQMRRVADKVEQMRKCMLAVQDALDVEKDEPLDSSGPHRLRNVPAYPGSTDDVQHPAASEVDEEKPGARVHFQIAESVEQEVTAEVREADFGL